MSAKSNHTQRRVLAAAASLAMLTALLVGLGSASAQGHPDPLTVRAGHFDTVNTLAVGSGVAAGAPFAALCFVDDDGSGTYNPGEPVYAQIGGCGALAGNDLRLTAAGGQAPGTQVRATHDDFGNPSLALGAAVVDFYDSDGDGVYSQNDPVYVDVGGTGAVAVGDVHLTTAGGRAPGETVRAGDSDVNNALSGAPPAAFAVGAWDYFDADADAAVNGWTAGDIAYIDADANGFVTAIDIRLGVHGEDPFGSQVMLGDGDLVYTLAVGTSGAAAPFAALCFIDDDGSGTYNPGEAVYASVAACGAVAGNDLRITPSAGQAAGTTVRATHQDFGNPELPLAAATVDFYDADGDGFYSLDDPVYIDVGGTGAVAVGDIHLTATATAAAGAGVQAGDSDVNNALAGAGAGPAAFQVGAWDYFDADGDALVNGWTSGDVAYIDADGNGLATVIDIRLGTIAGGAFGDQVSLLDPDTTALVTPFVFGGPPVVFVDDDGSGTPDTNEAYYLAPGGPGAVAANDVRIGNTAPNPLGSKVRGTDQDLGNPTLGTPAGFFGLAYYDADADGVFSGGDTLYWDTDASGAVSVGDLTVNGPEPALIVLAGNPAVNNVLTAWAGVLGFWDVDGDGVYTIPDIPYADTNGDGFVTVMDVGYRLPWGPIGTPPPGGAPPTDGADGEEPPADGADGEEPPADDNMTDGEEPPTNGTDGMDGEEPPADGGDGMEDGEEPPADGGDGMEDGEEPPADGGDAMEDGEEPPEEGGGTPGPAALLIVAAVFGAVLILRRRDTSKP